MKYEKVSETEGKIITPQIDKEEVLDIASLKKEIETLNEKIAYYTGMKSEKEKHLAEFEKLGIKEKVAEELKGEI